MLKQVTTDLWVATHKLRFYGTPVVTRMTVVRLPDGDLFVHSPVPRTPELAREVDALGPVRWVIAPNRFHHLWAGDWGARSGAHVQGTPGLARKRRDLPVESIRPDTRAPWSTVVDHALLEGLPMLDEAVFFHGPSRTLVVSDLFFNYRPATSLLVRLVRAIEDCDGKFTVPRVIRVLVRDRPALARSIAKVLGWDFDRIVMAHGDVVESGGKDRARAALDAWRR